MKQLLETLEGLWNSFDLLLGSIDFITLLAGYLPSILLSAVLVFLVVYVIRFFLMK